MKDKGDNLYCKCGTLIFSYGKGTDEYIATEVSEYQERIEKIKEEQRKRPICDCGGPMVPRSGPFGDFYGCVNYPNGCNKTVQRG